jgi:hypothetical protein
VRRAIVLLILLSLAAVVRAQGACPWLTQGTAAALMGGEVSATVHGSASEGTCEFQRSAPGSLRMSIAVSHAQPKQCTTGEPLTGIGQDAVLCSNDVDGEHRLVLRGRVRSSYFLLILTGKEASVSETASLRHALKQAAEEVAGNLY